MYCPNSPRTTSATSTNKTTLHPSWLMTARLLWSKSYASLDAEEIPVTNMALRQPTLDDVFLALTGRTAEEAATESEQDRD